MRLIDADALSSKGWMLARFYEGNKLVKTMPLSEVPTVKASQCDFCMYNPPSCLDGKPCCFCPAAVRGGLTNEI